MKYFYMSFCDVNRPTGQKFLGATVVQAEDEKSAFERATELGINPGGEVAFYPLKSLPSEGQHYLNTLIPREQVLAEGSTREPPRHVETFVCQEHNPVVRQ